MFKLHLNFYSKSLYLLVVILQINSTLSTCPLSDDGISPCTCKDDSIYCGGTESIDLIKIFNNLSIESNGKRKNFDKLFINNKAINELKANTFNDITFDYIRIDGADSLTTIANNAFNGSYERTKQIFITNNPKLENKANNSLFVELNKFKNILNIQLLNNSIEEIPENAFDGQQTQLRQLGFGGHSIRTVADNAFYHLNSLRILDISNTFISRLTEYVFAFSDKSENELSVNLESNPLITGASYAPKSLTYFQRPVKLNYGYTSVEVLTDYLDENVFLPFLQSDRRNHLTLSKLDCQDCRSFWLTKHEQLIPQIHIFLCSNGNALMHNNQWLLTNNFLNCSYI